MGLLENPLELKVKDILVNTFNSPILSPTSSIREAVLEMTKFPIGGCAIVEDGKLLGILVDGDIREFLTQKNPDLDRKITEVMTKNPITTTPGGFGHRCFICNGKSPKPNWNSPCYRE